MTPTPPSPHSRSTEHRFLSSTVAAYLSQLGRIGIAFVARLLLARLVLPEGHGIYELALRVVVLTSALRDLGLPYHLMRDERRPYGTVLASVLGLGLLMSLGLALGAPLFAGLEPQLPGVLRLFSLWVLLDAFHVVPRVYFERELRVGRLLVPEIARAFVTGAVAVSLAWWGLGVWSLVWGDLAAAFAFAWLLWRRARPGLELEVHLEWLPDLIRRSLTLLAIWIAIQAVTYLDIFVIDVFSDAEQVGYYARAYMVAFLVSGIVSPRSLTPALVEYRNDPVRFVGAFRVATVLLMSFQVVAAYFVYFNAERVVHILLGDNWIPSVELLRILCFVPFLDPFTRVGGEMLKVRNEDRVWLTTVLLNLVSLLCFGILFTSRWGTTGMAWANYFLAGNLLMAWRMHRICGSEFRHALRDLLTVYLVPLPLLGAAAWLAPVGSWSRFAASSLASAAALGCLAALFKESFRSFFRDRRGSGAPAHGDRSPGSAA